MDYEKKYKEIVGQIKKAYLYAQTDSTKAVLEEIFPELKESEDDQHRKWILEYLYDGMRKSDEQFKGQFKASIDWLKNQANQNVVTWHDVSEGPETNDELLCEWESDDHTWHEVGFYNADTKSFEYNIGQKVANVTRWCYIADLVGKQDKQESDSYCKENCKGYQETGKCYADWNCEAKRKAEQNLVWSEEDERVLIESITVLQLNSHWILADKLKSLKDKVQPKQEWSEEDESMRTRCIGVLGKCYMGELPTKVEEELNWLKSLRPQNRWKPSDKQMNALDSTLQYRKVSLNYSEHLNSLYNDLQKLRENKL